MSISYKESLKKAQLEAAQASVATLSLADVPTDDMSVAPAMAHDFGIATMSIEDDTIAAYAGDTWTLDTKYRYYSEYYDDSMSTVDAEKNIILGDNQINLTQETNSQFIPFEIPRFYDGFDLKTTQLLIYFVNKNKDDGYANPINVYYNSTKIKFGWLVDKRATAVEGKLQFEIQAIGANSNGDEYIWKTKPSDGLYVLASLSGNGTVEPDHTWITSFMSSVTEQVALAQEAGRNAEASATEAAASAEEANLASQQATTVVNTAKEELAESVQDAVDTKVADALMDYYSKTEADARTLEIVSTEINTALSDYYTKNETDTIFDDKVVAALSDYYTKDEVDEIVANVDISDQLQGVRDEIASIDGLANFDVGYDGSVMTFYNGETVMKTIDINSDPSTAWTTAYTKTVEDKIAAANSATQGDLDAYKTTVDADLEGIHSAIDGLPETLATDYYTKTDADTKFATKAALESTNTNVSNVATTADTNKSNITTLGTKVAALEDTLASVDTSPRLTYEATYDEEQIYTLWEIEGEGDAEVRTPKGQFKILGGANTGTTSSVLKIEYVTKTPYVATVNDRIAITYNFSGTDSSGDQVLEGVASWKVAGTTVATQTITAGENTFDITDYITLGTQKVLLSITDDAGSLVTKSWTVQKIDVRIESDFNDKRVFSTEEVSFDYTPYGAVSKDVHFILDGEELGTVTTSASGIPLPYTIPAQEHGSHLFQAYITAKLNDSETGTVTSNTIVKDIMYYDASVGTPVIGCAQQEFTARQHDTTSISFTVYDPATETPSVTLAVDGIAAPELTLTENTYVWQYKSTAVGDHTLTITCGETVKTLIAHIEELDIELEPVTAGLVFDFNPTGLSNESANHVWSDGNVSMTVSDNFDWVNGGYQIDENGDSYFCIKAGTSAEIDYQLFADDAKLDGKEFKLVFKTTNVAKPDAIFLHCMDNTTGTDHVGIKMDVQEANIYGMAGSLQLPYSEEDIIEFEFNISKDTEAVPMVMGYEDGVSTRPMVYDSSYSFTQNTPKVISLGSDDCDLHIYRFKVYNTSLTAKGILNNFIADARNAEEMIARYDRNQIYDENQNLDPDVLAAKCPWLRVYKVSAPYFTNNKSDKVPGTTIQQIYKNGDTVLDNWTCYNAMHSGQGTSSNNYGAAGRNQDFIMNKSGVEGVEPYFVMGDGSRATEITMTRTSVPVAYLNAKVNIASSNNMTNAMLANRYNQFNPYKRPFVRPDGVDTSFIKDTMEFHNCVIFIQETDPDLSTHREFADTNWHFYALGNIGDSKKTDNTRLTDPDDKYECCVEIMDVELPLSDFPADTMMNAMGYKLDETTQEKIYTWAKDENLGILYELIDGKYVLTEDETVDLNKTYYVDILEHDDFSEDYTYGWRYIYEGDDDDENAEVFDFCKQKWIEAYRFITTSTDEEFKAHIGDYFVLDSALYNYLFTTRYCMVDNRAKNSFWHYGKTGEVDAEGNPVRKWDLSWGYDMDTALGLNNYGKQVYRYGLEDTDVDEKGEEVFREADSTFFRRIRDLFPAELKAMYQTLESKGAWHAESFINQADAWQSEFPEELWRVDIERKYIRTYTTSFINGKADSQFLVNMSNGKMKYQRRGWERNQEQYMASKYQSTTASSDENSVVMRCTAPEGNLVVPLNYKLKLTPYAYMYLNVEYATGVVQVKAVPNVEYEIPFSGDKTDIIKVYSASRIQSLGDLSPCYLATIGTGAASKLKELNIGNATEGYDNPYFTTLTTGSNYLLEKLNVENVSGLTQSLDLSALSNLRELYAHGTNASGAIFANGGKLEIAELPAIGALTMKNLLYLATLDIADFSKLTRLTVENCSSIDLISILNNAPNINRVRITGVDWTLDDTSLLERLYTLKGFDKDGHEINRAVVTGKAHVPVIKQQALAEYTSAWPDLEITFDSMIEQFAFRFLNYDGSELEVQYVDKGADAVDPTTRVENPLNPTRESSVSHDYTFDKWDGSLTSVFADRTVTAVYTSSLRSYTVKYVSKGTTMQESTGLYGTNIVYNGVTPTYTAEEPAYSYYLFNRWDQSGVVTGDKTINAIFDKYTYTDGAFDNRELADMTPVEIYAMLKLASSSAQDTSKPLYLGDILTDLDDYTFTVGNDVEYDDIESVEVISEPTTFTGSNYIDSGIKLFEEDRDFVLAIDYEFGAGNTANAVLSQCFQTNGSNGFKLVYGTNGSFTGGRFTWGTISENLVTSGNREVVVLRHKAGENNLTIYKSNLSGVSVTSVELERTRTTLGDATLVFGGAKDDEGFFENMAVGNINWCKLWYMDLGDAECRNLAMWTHEKVTLEVCGFRRYDLSDGSGRRCSFSMLGAHLLDKNMKWGSTTSGGWANSDLNMILNNRFYLAIPRQIRSLVKQVNVPSSVGDNSTEISESACYVAIPSYVEVDSKNATVDPYISEGSSISYMAQNQNRIRSYADGTAGLYWTRSPNVSNSLYVWRVTNEGKTSGFVLPSNECGVLIMLSF